MIPNGCPIRIDADHLCSLAAPTRQSATSNPSVTARSAFWTEYCPDPCIHSDQPSFKGIGFLNACAREDNNEATNTADSDGSGKAASSDRI